MSQLTDFSQWMSLFSKWNSFEDDIISPLDIFNVSTLSDQDILEPIECAMNTIASHRFSYNTDCASGWIRHRNYFGHYSSSEGKQTDTDDSSSEVMSPDMSKLRIFPKENRSDVDLTPVKCRDTGYYTTPESTDDEEAISEDNERGSSRQAQVYKSHPNSLVPVRSAFNDTPDYTVSFTSSDDSYLERYGPSPNYERNVGSISPSSDSSSTRTYPNTDLCLSYEHESGLDETDDYYVSCAAHNYFASVHKMEDQHTYYMWMMIFHNYECSKDNFQSVMYSPCTYLHAWCSDLDLTREAPAAMPTAYTDRYCYEKGSTKGNDICSHPFEECDCTREAPACCVPVPGDAMFDFSSLMNLDPTKEAEINKNEQNKKFTEK